MSIQNEHELAVTQRKLFLLESEMASLDEGAGSPAVLASTRLSMGRVINQFKEEIARFRIGSRGNVFLMRCLRSPEEAENTRRKIETLERSIESYRREPAANDAIGRQSIRSLRRTMNEMKEQLLWFEAGVRQKVHA